MKLRLGKMTTSEMAEFFEVSAGYYRRTAVKEKFLDILKEYAKFEIVYGGVNIIEIFKEEYVPKDLPLKEIFERELKKLPSSIYFKGQVYGSLRQIAECTIDEINQIQKEKKLRIWSSIDYLAKKYGAISKELYGREVFNQKLYNRGFYMTQQIMNGRGPCGVRLSCMLIKEEFGYRELTLEEKELFKEINKEFDNEHSEEQQEELLAFKEAAYAKKYERDKEAQATLEAVEEKWARDFNKVRQEFILRTGLVLVPRGTAWKDEEPIKLAF